MVPIQILVLTIDKNNIIVKAATPGGVILNGTQNIDITGSFITFSGFQFTSGDIGPDYLIEVSGNHNTLTQLNFNGYSAKKYIQIAAGTNYNEISYCNIENKPVSADIGCTIQINTSPTVPGYHKIRYCSFKNFPGPGGDYGNEPIRIGLSTEMTNISRTIVEYCYFNNVGLGDGESISVKSTENICRYNTFTNNPEGMLVLRHGYRNVVYGNFFINGSGGIRIKEGANHYVYNNYFATGTADAIKLQYVVEYPLENINFIHNTFVNCGAIDLGGTGPTLVTFANNIFKKNSGNIFTNPNQGTSWAGNIRNGNLGITISSGMTNADPLLAINSDGYYGLTSLSPAINTSSSSYPAILDIENIDDDASVMLDISGQFRPAPLTLKDVGCDEYTTGTITNRPLNISDVGPSYLGGPHSLTIVATAGANGSISPNGVVTVNFNTNQTFIVAPNAGYHVDSLIVDGINTDSTTSYTFVGVSASHTIHAVFKINQYIIASTSGTGGTILPSGSVVVNHGSNQNFEISPNEHYSVESVVVDGVSVDSSTSYTFTNITSGHSIHAIFAIDRFAITATVNSDGEITPSGTVLVAYGASQTFTMTPATGYLY